MLPLLLQVTQTDPIPFSAFALCYGPLALVIIGLGVTFALTDWHARRPYLRLNPFVVARGDHVDRAPATGETPAGPLGPTGGADTTVSTGGYTNVAPANRPATDAPVVDDSTAHSPDKLPNAAIPSAGEQPPTTRPGQQRPRRRQ